MPAIISSGPIKHFCIISEWRRFNPLYSAVMLFLFFLMRVSQHGRSRKDDRTANMQTLLFQDNVMQESITKLQAILNLWLHSQSSAPQCDSIMFAVKANRCLTWVWQTHNVSYGAAWFCTARYNITDMKTTQGVNHIYYITCPIISFHFYCFLFNTVCFCFGVWWFCSLRNVFLVHLWPWHSRDLLELGFHVWNFLTAYLTPNESDNVGVNKSVAIGGSYM